MKPESKIMIWLKDPSPAGLLVLLAFFAIIAGAAVVACEEDETIGEMITRLDKAPWITARHNGDGWVERFAESFEEHAETYDIPPRLLVITVERESRFLTGSIGDHGRSFGLGHVVKMGRKKCKCDDSLGYDEEIRCSACWMRAGIDWCGSLVGGVTAYACGECKTNDPKVKYFVRYRLKHSGLLHLIGPPPDDFTVNHNIPADAGL